MSTLGRLSIYWSLMTGALGVHLPFFSLYLKDVRGFSGTQIGSVFAVPPLVAMLAQPFWGHVADRSGSRARVLALLSSGAAIGYALLILPRSYPAMLAATAWLAFFSTALMPMAVAVSLAAIAQDGDRVPFGRIRVWGTIGYFLVVMSVPSGLAFAARRLGVPERAIFQYVYALGAGLTALAALLALSLPNGPAHARARLQPGDQAWLVRHGPYLRVLLVSSLAYVFLQGPLQLLPVYARSRGGSTANVSQMWAWSLTLETLLMLYAARLYRRLGPRPTIALGIVACGVRWIGCAFCAQLFWVYPLQALHGAMVMSLQVGAPLLVESLVPDRLRASSQAGLTLLGSGIGGITSSALAGWVMDAYGIDAVMLIGGTGGLALGLLTPWLLPRK
jgi:PPP family 3-phenylpropionic acid transporter